MLSLGPWVNDLLLSRIRHQQNRPSQKRQAVFFKLEVLYILIYIDKTLILIEGSEMNDIDISLFRLVDWGDGTRDWLIVCYRGEEYLKPLHRETFDTKAEALKAITRLKKQYFKQGYQTIWVNISGMRGGVSRKKYVATILDGEGNRSINLMEEVE